MHQQREHKGHFKHSSVLNGWEPHLHRWFLYSGPVPPVLENCCVPNRSSPSSWFLCQIFEAFQSHAVLQKHEYLQRKEETNRFSTRREREHVNRGKTGTTVHTMVSRHAKNKPSVQTRWKIVDENRNKASPSRKRQDKQRPEGAGRKRLIALRSPPE